MKLSLFTNDKSTMKDEIILSIITLIFIGIGVALIITRPSFWVIKQNHSVVCGVLFAVTGIMYIPGLIYRFLTNDKKGKKKK